MNDHRLFGGRGNLEKGVVVDERDVDFRDHRRCRRQLPRNSEGRPGHRIPGREAPTVAQHVEDARPDILAFTAFPKEPWRQIWSNNQQERLNREIRPAHRPGLHLPQPGSPDPPCRCRPRRAVRRVGRRSPLPRPGSRAPITTHLDQHRNQDQHRHCPGGCHNPSPDRLNTPPPDHTVTVFLHHGPGLDPCHRCHLCQVPPDA